MCSACNVAVGGCADDYALKHIYVAYFIYNLCHETEFPSIRQWLLQSGRPGRFAVLWCNQRLFLPRRGLQNRARWVLRLGGAEAPQCSVCVPLALVFRPSQGGADALEVFGRAAAPGSWPTAWASF